MSKKLVSPEAHHEQVVKGLYDQMKPVFDSSEQPIFLYLDDNQSLQQQICQDAGLQVATGMGGDTRRLRRVCCREKSGNIDDGVLGCDEEKDSINHSDNVDEERRRNNRFNGDSRAH